jgi:hypothetical protein
MTAKEIKKLLIDKELTVSEVATQIDEDVTAVSRVLNYERTTERIRRKLQRRFGITFDEERKAA